MRLIYGTLIELSIYMMSKYRAKAIKHSLVVDSLSVCKTILQSSARVALSSLLILSMVSCGPGGSQGPTQYITNYGSDKKLPDDDGYTGSGGTGDGGGGQGILCSKDTKNPEFRDKLFVRDIFEAMYNSKLTIKKNVTNPQKTSEKVDAESITLLIEILKQYFGPALPQMEIGREKYWTDFSKKISFLDEEAKLYPSQDANSPIALPSGCKIVQIAYWDDSTGKADNGTLYVDRAQWNRLDTLNKAALLAHEYFFKEARRAGHKNSDFVRARVGQLFSEKMLPPAFPNWSGADLSGRTASLPKEKGDLLFCSGTSDADPSATVHVYFGLNTITIPVLRSTTISLSSLQSRPLPSNYMVANAAKIHHLFSSIKKVDRKSLFTPQERYLLNLNARGNGLNSFYDDTSFSSWLDRSSDELLKFPNPIWRSSLPSSGSDLRVSLTNPIVKSENGFKIKDQKDVETVFFQILEAEILVAEGKVRNRTRDRLTARQTPLKEIAVLNEEVSSHVTKGTLPASFPKWEAAMGSLADEIFKDDPVPNYKRRFLEAGANFKRYPIYLFKMKVGALSKNDIATLSQIYDALFSDSLGYEIAPMKLTIQSYQGSLEFTLNCFDYGYLYSNLSSFKILETMDEKRNDLMFDVDPYAFRIFDPQYDSYDESDTEETKIYKKENRQRTLDHFNDTLKEAINSIRGLGNYDFECTTLALESLLCDSKSVLSAKLKRVDKINVRSCRDFDKNVFELSDTEPGGEDQNHCFIFHISQDDSYYLVNFERTGYRPEIMVRAIDEPVDREQSRPGEYP